MVNRLNSHTASSSQERTLHIGGDAAFRFVYMHPTSLHGGHRDNPSDTR